MFHQLTTKTFNWILIIGVILFIFEIIIFHGGNIFNAVFSAIVMYIGWKNFNKLWGKIVFWIFLINLVIAFFNLLAVRFLIAAILVLFVLDYAKKNKETDFLTPSLPGEINQGKVVKIEPLFDHTMFGDQKTKDSAYSWKDINIHGGFGNRIIDLSNTVLPNDTAIISIRHIMGKIEIYVPYEVEVSIHHSSVFGRATIFEERHMNLMNKSLLYQTENYDTTYPRIKIVTSILSGDIEVIRI